MGTVQYLTVNGRVLAENRNGVKRDYIPDSQGNTIALMDSTGALTDTFSYFPSGAVASRTGTTPTPFQWNGRSGYYRDTPTRNYVRARNFYVNLGRWSTPDPIGFDGGDFNLYRYVNNRFVTMNDPSGLSKTFCMPGGVRATKIKPAKNCCKWNPQKQEMTVDCKPQIDVTSFWTCFSEDPNVDLENAIIVENYWNIYQYVNVLTMQEVKNGNKEICPSQGRGLYDACGKPCGTTSCSPRPYCNNLNFGLGTCDTPTPLSITPVPNRKPPLYMLKAQWVLTDAPGAKRTVSMGDSLTLKWELDFKTWLSPMKYNEPSVENPDVLRGPWSVMVVKWHVSIDVNVNLGDTLTVKCNGNIRLL